MTYRLITNDGYVTSFSELDDLAAQVLKDFDAGRKIRVRVNTSNLGRGQRVMTAEETAMLVARVGELDKEER